MIQKFKKFLENKENETKKIEGTLPFFPGFYETPFGDFESQEMSEIDNYNQEHNTNLDYDDFDWDYDEAFEDVIKLCVDALEPEILKLPFVEKMNFVDLYSPKEYNYRNEQINIDYEVDYDKMKKYFIGDSTLEDIENYDFSDDVEYKIELIDGYIKSEYTSGPGFTSFYSNDVQEWLIGLFNDDLSDTQLTSLIEYALEYENEDESDAIYDSNSLFEVISDEFLAVYPKMTLSEN